MSIDPLSLAVGIPAYRNYVHSGVLYQVANLAVWATTNRRKVTLNTANSCSLDWSRNMLLHAAIKQECAWCLMLDVDTYLPDAGVLERMLRTANGSGAAVIAAPVPMRNRPGYNVQIRNDAGLVRYATIGEVDGNVLDVAHVGTAFMAINCGWIIKNWPHVAPGDLSGSMWFQTIQTWAHDGVDLPAKTGEDFAFCAGVAKRGGRILCDGRVKPAHAEATSETAVLVEHLGASLTTSDPGAKAA